MKHLKFHIIHFLFALACIVSYAQNENYKGYTIKGDTVVFSFDVRDYSKFTKEYSGQVIDFNDFDINNVVVSGEFNNWSRNNWKMKKINNFKYELRKSIKDFNDEFSWEFKFIINNSYWAEPSRKDPNIVNATKNGYNLGVFNLKMYTAFPSSNGNAYFKLRGYNNAKKVVVAGTFNKWNENLFIMNKTKDGWELTLQMKPNEYEYRFIVDGKWIEDPDNNNKKRNEFNEYNSVLDIKEYTAFKLKGYSSAKKVVLAGTFNNWNEFDFVMEKTDYGWKYVVPLSGGKHQYKFIVDGIWITDPNNSVKEYDGNGNINSVKMVK